MIRGWHPGWVVIGDVMGGDPIIASPKEAGTPLYVAVHGVGTWKPVLAAKSLEIGVTALAEWLDVFRGDYGGKIVDERFVPRSDAIAKIRSRVAKIVGRAVEPWLPTRG